MGVNTAQRRELAGRHPKMVLVGANFAVSAAAEKAELDMATVNAQMDNVLEATLAGAAGNLITVAVVGDSPTGAGVTITRVGTAFTIHFESGVSTQGHVNTAIGLLAGADDLIGVKTAGTEATTLVNGRASLDLGSVFSAVDSNIQAGFNTGADGNTYTVKAVHDGTGAGSVEVVDFTGGKILVIHYESAVTTVAQFEAALAALSPADFELLVAGTPAAAFVAGDDCGTDMLGSGTDTHAEQAATALAGGTAEGAVTDLVGGEREIDSVTHTGVGLYRVTLLDDFPEVLAVDACWQDADAASYEVQGVAFDPKAKTYDFRIHNAAGAAVDPADGRVNVLLVLSNMRDGRIAALT